LRGAPFRTCTIGYLLILETPNVCDDLAEAVLRRKMAGVEPVHFRIREIAPVRFSLFRGETNVVLSPKDQRFGWFSGRTSAPLDAGRR
jgi:hypothetical protein